MKGLPEVKLLNQANILAWTQMIISLANASLFKIVCWHKFLFVIRFPKCLQHILLQTNGLILSRKYFTPSFMNYKSRRMYSQRPISAHLDLGLIVSRSGSNLGPLDCKASTQTTAPWLLLHVFVCVEVLRPCQQLRSCRAGQLPINTVPGQV